MKNPHSFFRKPQKKESVKSSALIFPKGQNYVDVELSDAEIKKYKDGGYVVQELNKMAKGGSACPPGYYHNGNKCIKIPEAQIPTNADSLFLYQNSLNKDNWAKKNNYTIKQYPYNEGESSLINRNIKELGLLGHLKDIYKQDLKSGEKNKAFNQYVDVRGNLIGSSDWLPSGEDDFGLPKTYRHPYIKPQFEGDYMSTDRNKPVSYGYFYDPVAIKPGNLLNQDEVAIRIKKYGKQGIPQNKIEEYNNILLQQQQLIDAGFEIGKADGIWGDKSKAAWEEFQNKTNEEIKNTETKPELELEKLPLLPPKLIDTSRAELQGEYQEEPELVPPNWGQHEPSTYRLPVKPKYRGKLQNPSRYNPVAAMTQYFSGYEPLDEEEYVDVEDRIVPKGFTSLQDIGVQRRYNKAYDEYKAKQQEYEAKERYKQMMGNALAVKFKKYGGAIEKELTDDEIKWYKSKGYIVEEID
jgi:hypothetical protein